MCMMYSTKMYHTVVTAEFFLKRSHSAVEGISLGSLALKLDTLTLPEILKANSLNTFFPALTSLSGFCGLQ